MQPSSRPPRLILIVFASTRKLSTRKSSTMKPACKSRSRKRLSKSKFEKATTTQLFLEPEFSTDELPLNDTSYAMEAFWGTGSPLNDNSKYTSSSQPASDPSDISKDFPNEDLMTLFPSMERDDYGPP